MENAAAYVDCLCGGVLKVILGGVVSGELKECTLKFGGNFVVDEGRVDVFV